MTRYTRPAIGSVLAFTLLIAAPSALTQDESAEERLHVHRYGSKYTAPYDAFQYLNRINAAPNEDETPQEYSGRVFGRLANQEGRILLKIPEGYDRDTYEGYKTFMRTFGENSVGNCVTCHTPPDFTDNTFHNTGVSLTAYEDIHGAGSFAEIDIPSVRDAVRPSKRLSKAPEKGKPGQVNLGHWNYVDVNDDSLREPGESKSRLLKSMIGAFKTPTLRNIADDAPYNHNEQFKTLEDVIRHKVRVSQLAKEGKAPHVDEAFQNMRLTEADVKPLVQFLRTLNEVSEEKFREMVLSTEILDTSYLFE